MTEAKAKSKKDLALPVDTASSEPIDLNSFSAKKTAMSGALGFGLLCSNADQIRTILLLEQRNDVDYTRLGILAFSLLLQVVTMSLLTVLSASGKVNQARKKKQNGLNTSAMVLSFLVTVLNLLATVFQGNATSLVKRFN
ncbi:uncharacterized protein LOC111697651 isoform X1 [Eurytemora carolleeae]|uniref:uncharacterized protein LOC111697651 isoform X1 n=1 Tax=Eurytemora carolleeae TaxID=1294199 RepID=UPI000C78D6B7|nr:uncharacterized protein LOC111697651 isoform X1 [Eurytemora carolleeae]|eukprot:XP_023323492.1 uncharacterized protein LOC111697651 isoform X1 [Eurytemora affinis]